MKKLLVGGVAAGMLTSAALFGNGVASADTALIVPGTAPSPYKPLRSLYHFNPATDPQIGQNFYNPASARVVVPYPGSFWPVTGLNSPTIGQSVNTGANNLDAAIRRTNGPISAAGLSQGTLALDREQARLANDPTAPPPGQLTFIKAGDPNNLLSHVFRPGTHVPVIDYTVPGAVESQYDTINIVGQYDIFSNPPERMGNLLAVLNGITAGGYYGHSATAFADPSRVAPGDITTTVNSRGATTTTYLIRNEGDLPLVKALVDMAHLPPEAVGPLNAVLTPMIDRAYGPPQGPTPLPSDLVNGFHSVHGIGPAISIPIESTNAGITAATTGLSLANIVGRAAAAAPNALAGANAAPNALAGAKAGANALPGKGGPGPGKGGPGPGKGGPLSKVGDLLPKGKK